MQRQGIPGCSLAKMGELSQGENLSKEQDKEQLKKICFVFLWPPYTQSCTYLYITTYTHIYTHRHTHTQACPAARDKRVPTVYRYAGYQEQPSLSATTSKTECSFFSSSEHNSQSSDPVQAISADRPIGSFVILSLLWPLIRLCALGEICFGLVPPSLQMAMAQTLILGGREDVLKSWAQARGLAECSPRLVVFWAFPEYISKKHCKVGGQSHLFISKFTGALGY